MFITGDDVSWSLGRDGALFLQKKISDTWFT